MNTYEQLRRLSAVSGRTLRQRTRHATRASPAPVVSPGVGRARRARAPLRRADRSSRSAAAPASSRACCVTWAVRNYLGLDTNAARLAQARATCPEYRFEVADVFLTNHLRSEDYDVAVMTGFLEFVRWDLVALELVRPHRRVLGTVTAGDEPGRVRQFTSANQVPGPLLAGAAGTARRTDPPAARPHGVPVRRHQVRLGDRRAGAGLPVPGLRPARQVRVPQQPCGDGAPRAPARGERSGLRRWSARPASHALPPSTCAGRGRRAATRRAVATPSTGRRPRSTDRCRESAPATGRVLVGQARDALERHGALLRSAARARRRSGPSAG